MPMTYLARPAAIVFAIISVPLRLLSGLGWAPFNMHPVGALGVFGGARVRSWLAYALPLAVMVLTDLVLWAVFQSDQYSPFHVSRAAVYPCILLYVLLGRWLVTDQNPLRIGAAALAGSLLFFVVTNFASWLELSHLYPRDLAGLWACYVAAWPFYQSTFVGDLAFTAIFFGVHEIASRSIRTEAATVHS